MARRRTDDIDDGTPIDLRPVIDPDPLDLRVSVPSIVHWADSQEVRRRVMEAVGFPVDDMAMFLVVNQLSYRGAMSPSDLAHVLGTGRPNVTKIAHRLREAGLIVRVPDPDDERGILVALTPSGREIGERILDNARRAFDATLRHWSAEDRDVLARMLARLAHDTTAGPRRSSPAAGDRPEAGRPPGYPGEPPVTNGASASASSGERSST